MKKRITVLTLAIVICFTVVAAASVNEEYKGFSIVNVLVNGQKLESQVPGVNFHDSTVLPLKAVSEAMNTIVDWDSKTNTANLIKPEVNIIVMDDILENEDETISLYNPFGLIPQHEVMDFFALVQVHELKEGNYEFRIVISDPNGKEVVVSPTDTYKVEKDSFGGFDYYELFENVSFHKLGEYVVQFQLKHNSKFYTVGEKTLVVY
ncbi:Copper amine oxidase N-terminal domain-containing protein [Anaerovirgula multivorans]|uniref:Copper amine oxidase N-terminal domain-containing protein n=1 Tax=Anaerovirgula multivorans TaxID=312168 RepID=A0A239F579_9FIRM|nr:stalk domain-containing protein [Anaerovirgula multivorans]SNS52180.1 Copper amine oxidase N-terminal domain-containing protein [Anaerovirgula multivorans]